MKKILLFTAILFASITMGNAQNTSDEATLTVRLHAIQSIVVTSTQKDIVLNYKTIDDYKDGVPLLRENHLTIFSTGAFVVKVASATNEINRVDGTEIIESTGLKVQASDGYTNALTGAGMPEVKLSTTATDFIISTVGGVNKHFNVTYSGLGENAYINKHFNAENPTEYTTTVTYTITPI